MFWQPKAGDFKVPGIGEVEIGINQLQDHGVMFCACNMALTVLSAVAAQNMNMDAKEVYNDWSSGILPGHTNCSFRCLGCGQGAGTWMRLLLFRV